MAARQNQDEQVKAFWDKTEEELGEEVIVYTMGRCLSGCGDVDVRGQIWGLFFVTERALYFRHFPRHSWLDSLVSGSRSAGGDQEIYFSIPMNRMQSVSLNREASLLKRLLSATPPVFSIDYIEADASVQTLRFFLETRIDTFFKVIESCRE